MKPRNLLKVKKISLFTIRTLFCTLLLLLVLVACRIRNIDSTIIKETPNSETVIDTQKGEENLPFPSSSSTSDTYATLSTTPTLLSTSIPPFYEINNLVVGIPGQVIYDDKNESSGNYLFHNTKVTLFLGNETDVFVNINLDDMKTSNMENSDIIIEKTTGSETFYLLFPINGAGYFYSDEDIYEYEACINSIPLRKMSYFDYLKQEHSFIKGKKYCIYTNEGHVALVNYIRGSVEYTSDYSSKISIEVTVFSKKDEWSNFEF